MSDLEANIYSSYIVNIRTPAYSIHIEPIYEIKVFIFRSYTTSRV